MRWEGSTACWDAVPGADWYTVEWYFSETRDGEYDNIGGSYVRSGTSSTLAEWSESMIAKGYYKFCVRAMSDDANKVRPGELSGQSDIYSTNAVVDRIDSAMDGILENLGENPDEYDVKAAVEQVKELDKNELLTAMSADKEDTGVNSKIKELEGRTGIDVETVVSEDIVLDGSSISVTGAALNAAEGSSKVTLNIGKPEKETVVPGVYANAVQFGFEIDGTTAQSSETLDVPIKITMPIPENIVPEKLRILHYQSDGTIEEIILPYVFCGNDGQWYASFVVTHFSTFVFAELNQGIGEEYFIESLDIRDSSGSSLSEIPAENFYADIDILRTAAAQDAVLVLAAYDQDGKMLNSYHTDVISEINGMETDDIISQNIYIENPGGKVKEIKAFLLSSQGTLEPVCLPVSIH